MAVYFFDSSAVVKRYVSETGTSWVLGVTDPVANNHIHIARVTGVEVVSAITRRTRGGSLSAADAATAIAGFRYDFATSYRVVDITTALIINAMRLAETHALRGYDSIQLAAALEVNVQALSVGLRALTLVSSDTDLNAAAVREGLTTEDPNAHP
ncbi:MAG TPA: type II toxin-antitoxin system VapC family toxin [Blastocatellia bacterium]|nr:type II toxin-antitoxin system VapC family toxin [Blastocatellia bacterium]